ncbi:MAG: polysaccharide deacetylase family protein [Gammaproteobacteria bacterium]
MIDVFFTVDTETWCNGWNNLDAEFPAAFGRYIHGHTRRGDHGIPLQMRILTDHGLTGVYFIEPLFATRFGPEPLAEIVGLVNEAGHEAQLHLHTEWVDEARSGRLPKLDGKRQHLRMFSLDDQVQLLSEARRLLMEAGADAPNAFRAGNYGFNRDSLRALARLGIRFDSSYNPASIAGVADVAPGQLLTQPVELEGVIEYPVSVFRDRGERSLRNLQFTACSFAEIRHVLDTAERSGWQSVVIVSHSFELLGRSKTAPDPWAVRRFERMCAYLGKHRDRFKVRGFRGLGESVADDQPEPVQSNPLRTAGRYAEQALRRLAR